jgi:hypothetical protein
MVTHDATAVKTDCQQLGPHYINRLLIAFCTDDPEVTDLGQLSGELASKAGTIDISGYHTLDLSTSVPMTDGDDFFILVELSDGGHAIDRTSTVPVLLGAPAVTDGSIVSDAATGESFYFEDGQWQDLYGMYLYGDDVGREVTGSANFCIKGFTAVPEPATFALLALGGAALLRRRL